MFCPVGYRSAAALWQEYRARRLRAVYVLAAKAYGDHSTKFSLLRGSPLDICEFLFLNSLCRVGLYLASSKGDVVRIFMVVEDGRYSLLSVLTPWKSAYHHAAARLDDAHKIALASLTGNEFAPWPYEVSERESWAETYPNLTEQEYEIKLKLGFLTHHHALPKHFIRPTYLIAKTIPPWASEDIDNSEIGPILENYGGWSICVDEATYNGEWQEYLSGQKQIFSNDAVLQKAAKLGRPRLELAYAAFSSMNFDKGKLSWAQLRSKIKRETGEEPCDKTLRNWRDENSYTE